MKAKLLTALCLLGLFAVASGAETVSKPAKAKPEKKTSPAPSSFQRTTNAPIRPGVFTMDRQAIDRTPAADLHFLLTRVPMTR